MDMYEKKIKEEIIFIKKIKIVWNKNLIYLIKLVCYFILYVVFIESILFLY